MQIPDFDTRGPAPRAQRHAAWAAAVAPQAMLEALADTFAAPQRRPSPVQAAALRRFAARCAGQRLTRRCGAAGHDRSARRAQAAHLATVADGLVSSAVAPGDATAVHWLNVSVARAAAARLLDPLIRADAAAVLAAFHALDADAYAAAVQASSVLERYGASNERDAQLVRSEQAAWLYELFGTVLPATPRVERREVGPWEVDRGWARPEAERLRQLRRYRDALLALDAWIPVPLSSGNYLFGIAERPLPIGALCYLWEVWDAATGSCPACGGEAVGFAMGGRSRVGGVIGCCLVCERRLRRPIGGLGAVAAAMAPALEGTPYTVTRTVWTPAPPAAAEAFDAAVAAVVVQAALEDRAG